MSCAARSTEAAPIQKYLRTLRSFTVIEINVAWLNDCIVFDVVARALGRWRIFRFVDHTLKMRKAEEIP